MIASTGYTKTEIEAMERAARKLLDIPALPDTLTDDIRADVAESGIHAALLKWTSTVAYAFALDTDPAEFKARSGRTAEHYRHPVKDEYCYPVNALATKLADPSARAKCAAAELAVLDAHAAAAKPLPKEWEPAADVTPKPVGEPIVRIR